jgi:hypothetical protein
VTASAAGARRFSSTAPGRGSCRDGPGASALLWWQRHAQPSHLTSVTDSTPESLDDTETCQWLLSTIVATVPTTVELVGTL